MADYGSAELNTLLGGSAAPAAATSSVPKQSTANYGSPELNTLLGGTSGATAPVTDPVTPTLTIDQGPVPVVPVKAPGIVSKVEGAVSKVGKGIAGIFNTKKGPSLQATVGENLTPEEQAAAEQTLAKQEADAQNLNQTTVKLPFIDKGFTMNNGADNGAVESLVKSAVELPEKSIRSPIDALNGEQNSDQRANTKVYSIPSYAETAGKTTGQLIDQGVSPVAAVLLASAQSSGQFANDALIYDGLLTSGAEKVATGTGAITSDELKTAHEFLGSPATMEEARANYLKIQKEFHPDINGGNDAVSKQANNAYQILKKEGIPTGSVAGTVDARPQAPAEQVKAIGDGTSTYGSPELDTLLGAEKPAVVPETAPTEDISRETPVVQPEPSQPQALGNLEGINPAQDTALTPEQVAPLAQKAADIHYDNVQAPAQKAGKPTIIGADDLKDYHGNDYNDKNHPVYSRAAYLQYEKALKVNPDPTVILTGGGPASGKTELLTKGLVKDGFKGVLYDSNMANFDGVKKQIDMAKAAGKNVEIYGVLPNLDNARTFSIQREGRIGRGISDATFARGHAGFPSVALRLLEEGVISPDQVHIMDTRNVKDFSDAQQMMQDNDYVKDPVATLKNLGYNEEELKNTYAKTNYDISTGERREPVPEGGGSSNAPTQYGADKIHADGKGDERQLGTSEKEKEGGEVKPFANTEKVTSKQESVPKKKNPEENLQGGFIDAGPIADKIKAKTEAFKKFLTDTSRSIDIGDNTGDDLYKLEKNTQADIQQAVNTLKDLPGTPKDYKAITHYIDDKSVKLTPLQEEIYAKFVKPMQEARTSIFNKLKGEKFPVTAEDYSPRFVSGKGGVIDRLLSSLKERGASLPSGGKLSKTGPMMKHRVMRSITDENGNRQVVSIKKGRVTAFTEKKPSDLGPLKMKTREQLVDQDIKPIQKKIERTQKLIDILESVKTRDPVSEKRLSGMQKKIDDLKSIVKENSEVGLENRKQDDSIKTEQKKYNAKIKELEIKVSALSKFSTLPKVDSQIESLSKEIDVLYENEASLFMRDLYENISETAKENSGIDAITSKKIAKSVAELKTLSRVAKGSDVVLTKTRIENAKSKLIDLVNNIAELENKYDPSQLTGKVFVDKNDNVHTIGEATIKELEQHTNLQYHKNAVVNETVSYLKLRQLERAADFVEAFKNSPQFKDIAVENGKEVPEGWKPTTLPQFIGYNFEPRTAEVLNDFDNKMHEPGGVEMLVGPLNRFLRDAIFFNPLIHIPNIGVHWGANYGISRTLNPVEYKRAAQAFNKAINAVVTKNDDYLAALRSGSPLMSGETDSKAIGKALLNKMAEELETHPLLAEKVSHALSYGNPAKLVKLVYEYAGKATWLANDVMTLQATYQDMATNGHTLEESIAETSKHIPDYRLPSRIADKPLTALFGEKTGGRISRGLARSTNSPLFMFGAYHYGALKSYGEMAKDLVSTTTSAKEKAQVLDKIAMLALIGLVLYPQLDKLARKVTGNPNSKFRRAGSTTLPYNISRLARGYETVPQFLESVLTPSPALKVGVETLMANRDLFTGKPIYGASGTGLAQYLENQIAPLQQGNKVVQGKSSLDELLASFAGISSPKNSDQANQINEMVYDEKPVLDNQIKQLISEGRTTEANALGYGFNQRLRANIVSVLKSSNLPTDDATVEKYMKADEYKLPGAKAMQNYAAKGKTSDQSIIQTVITYAKAIGTDPQTAFDRIFTGQKIIRVDNPGLFRKNAAVIVQHDEKSGIDPNSSEFKVRKQFQQDQGLSDEAMKGLQLDHIIPVSDGGSNTMDGSNYQLVSTYNNEVLHQKVEKPIADALEKGQITRAKVREYIIRYKAGTLGEPLTPAMQKEYKEKYGSQPISAEQVVEEIRNGKAK